MNHILQSGFNLIDPVGPRLGYMLRRASAVMMAHLGASLAPLDLRPVEATILLLIGANPNCSQSDLGRLLGIKRANMVPLIAGLVAKQMISKSVGGGRSHALSLTAAGETARGAAEKIMDAVDGRYESMLDPAQRAVLDDALRRIAAGLGNGEE